ncbi:TPA: restriction endonuclease subunit S [Vibrio parahaemolyticus]|nr:restriction endonuclease subunit S [Vibrio parahaemolyticus]
MVPNGWSVAQFGDLADFKSGGTPSKQNASYWGGEEPWISGKDLKSHYLYRSIDQLTTEGFHIAKKAPLGASLILVRGMTLLKDFPVGYATREVAFNQDIKALLAKANVDGLFLSFLLVGNKHKIKNLVTTAGHGTGRLDTDSLKEFPVDLPPLSEQRKIAKILSTWDKAIATTEKLIETSKQQKKALMQQLLTGKKRLVNPETGKVFEGEWEEVHVSDIATTKKGKALSAKDIVAGKYPVIAGGKSSPYTHNNFTHENVITISASGAYAGYVSYHPYKIWASDCSVIEAKVNNCLGFIFQWLLLNQNRIYSMQSGGAQPHIYPKDIDVLRLRKPQFDEQQKIASVLTAADKEIEVLEAKLAHFKQEKKALMQQLLTGKRRVTLE